MVVIAMSIPKSDLGGADRGRLAMMAAVHDAAEARVGDLTPHCNVSKAEKARREKEAIEGMVGHIEDKGRFPFFFMYIRTYTHA